MSTRSNIRCPSCNGPLVPVELRCEKCEVSVVGEFANNEFASLAEDDLHFLRIFVRCEGRIRDMESAMGVSYPTIKARMAQLKVALMPPPAPPVVPPVAGPAPENTDAATAILGQLEAGRITYEQARERLQKIPKGNMP